MSGVGCVQEAWKESHHADCWPPIRHRRGLHGCSSELWDADRRQGAPGCGGRFCLSRCDPVQFRDGSCAHEGPPEPNLPGTAPVVLSVSPLYPIICVYTREGFFAMSLVTRPHHRGARAHEKGFRCCVLESSGATRLQSQGQEAFVNPGWTKTLHEAVTQGDGSSVQAEFHVVAHVVP